MKLCPLSSAAGLDPGSSHRCVVLSSFKVLKLWKHEQAFPFCPLRFFFFFNFAGGSPNSHKMGWTVSCWLWRELQRRPELKRVSRALTTDILSILWTFTHGNSGIGLTVLPNIWTTCVQCLSKTVDHLSWSLSVCSAQVICLFLSSAIRSFLGGNAKTKAHMTSSES